MASSAQPISAIEENGDKSSQFDISAKVLVWLAVLALIVSVCFKLWRLDSRELWLDETESWFNSSLPFADMMHYNVGDTHPPLYFILLWLWIRIAGDAQTHLRLFGVLLNVCSIVAMFLLGRRALGPRFGALAVVLFAFSPMLYVYSLELRMYTLSILFFICLLLVHWELVVGQKDSSRLIVAYVLLAALFFFVHYMAVFVLLGLLTHWALNCTSRKRMRSLCVATALTLLLVSPWIPVLVHQRTIKLQLYRDLDRSYNNPESLTYGAHPPAGSSSVPAKDIAVTAGFYPAESPLLLLLCAVPLAAVIAGIGFLALWRADQACRLCAIVALAIAIGCFLLHIVSTRYMLLVVPTLTLAMARVIQYWSAPKGWRTVGLVTGTMVVAIYGTGYIRQALLPHGRPWENLVSNLQQNYQPGDEVIFEVLYTQVPFDYFATQRHFQPQETGFPVSIYDWWGSQPLKTWGGPVLLQSDLSQYVAKLSASKSRTLWLVSYETSYYDPHEALLGALRQMGHVTEFPLPPEPRVFGAGSPLRLIRVSIP